MPILAKLFIWGVTYQQAVTTGVWTEYETYQYAPDPIPFGIRDCGLIFVSGEVKYILRPECL